MTPHLFTFTFGTVWVIGDSLVQRADHSLCCRTQVHGHGIGGGGLTDIPKLLSVMEARAPDPKLIIVHIGTNDLLKVDSFAFRARVRVFMHECVLRFQSARIVWSDILPRACYFGTRFPARADRKRRSINRWCRSVGNKFGITTLAHPQFCFDQYHLYAYYGVHLSAAGNRLFSGNIRDCIQYHVGGL